MLSRLSILGRSTRSLPAILNTVRHESTRAAEPRIKSVSEYYRDPSSTDTIPQLHQRRLVPTMPTVYSQNPPHEQFLAGLTDLLNKYISLPFDKKNISGRTYLTFDDYHDMCGQSKLKITQYHKIVAVVKRLDSIEPQLKTKVVEDVLAKFKKNRESLTADSSKKTLDSKGRAVAVGRRKSSSAKAYVVKGSGEMLVNGKPMEEVFPRYNDRLKLLYPLQVIGGEGEYNVFALCRGGGNTGQVDSITLAIARALCIHNPLLKKRLFTAGCLTRDHRVVERKKPGKVKARKMPTWVKR